MRISLTAATICFVYFCNAPAAISVDGMVQSQNQTAPVSTTNEDVLFANPIKLSVSQNAPASDRPQYSGSFPMNRAVEVGLKHSLEYAQSEIDTKISRFNTRSALGKFGPSVSANTFYSESSVNQMLFFPNDPTLGASTMQPIGKGSSFSLIFAGIQPLFTGGALRGNFKAVKAQEKQSLARYRQSKIDTARTIKQMYLQTAWNEARLRVDSDYVKFRTLSTANMRQRMTEGRAPRADFLREESELAQAKAQVNQDYRDYNVSLINLKASMGINLASLLNVSDSLEFVDTPGDLDNFLNMAGNNRPEIAQAQSRLEEMQGKRLIVRSRYAPHVYLYGLGSNITGRTPSPDGSSPNPNQNGQWGGLVSVMGHYTLYDSGQREADLHAASQAVKQSTLALEQAQLKIAQDVSIAWVDLDLSKRNIDLAKAQVSSAEEDYRLIHSRYDIGKSTALEQFDAAVKLFRARLALTQAVYNYRLAQTQIVWASGSI